MEIIKETCYKGTRILLGDEKRTVIDSMVRLLRITGFQEISIPIIQFEDTFRDKVGEENNNLMFTLRDRKGRNLCLAPEYTAVVQQLAKTEFKDEQNIKLFYVQECFRGEKPQAGRYRQFTQLGVEILNPNDPEKLMDILEKMACNLVSTVADHFIFNRNVKRGLDYYKDGRGFEIRISELGAQEQVCGGGEYDGGMGFAIGIDRLLLLTS